ncbi:MAG: hypothetical protein L0Y44_10810 [Phycisphaerales bacterium]|nr:hypothetical protein [Phycisphaerales bacterium]MCI0675345.1 hypothetical protein [Phycisphaerales bacterium]
MLLISLAIPAFIMVGVLIAVFLFVRRQGATISPVLIALLLFPVALPLLLPFFLARKGRSISTLVPKHHAMVCPKCIVPLDSTDQTDRMSCPKCRADYKADHLRTFWDRYLADPVDASRWWLTVAPPTKRGSGFKVFMGRMHGKPLGMIGINAVIWLGAGMLIGLVRGSSVIGAALTYVDMFLLMCGFFLLMAGWKRREGDTTRCAACTYQRFAGIGAAQLERCPECGADWNAPGGAIHGDVRRSPWLIATGAFLMLVAFGLISSQFHVGAWQLQILPTNALIKEVARAPRGFTRDEWIELNSRTLSRAQSLRLAEALLDKRIRKGYFSADADNWLVTQIASGSLPQPLVERYYREALDVWIVAPAKSKVNESVTVAIGTRDRHASSTNPKPVALIAGFLFGDNGQACCRQDQGIAGIMLGQQRLHFDHEAGSGQGPKAIFQPDRPGPLRVQLDIWLAHLPPPGTVNPIVWNADGTPADPVGAVWMEHRTIEHVIEILP